MLNTQDELFSIFDRLSIPYTNHEHPAVYTVEEAALYHEGMDGAHSKNLFFKDKKKNLFLVVTLDEKPVVIKEMAKKIGAKSPSFGKPELLADVLGVIPGAVTPLAVVNAKDQPLKVILDEEMMENDLLNFHPLVNTATTTISSTDLVKFLEYCEVDFEIMRL